MLFFNSREFKEDKSAKEICFPATLTQQEKACIKQTAQEMGLKVEGREVLEMLLVFTVVYFKAPLGVCNGNSSVTYDNNLVITLFTLLRDPFWSSRFDYMITWNENPLKNISKHSFRTLLTRFQVKANNCCIYVLHRSSEKKWPLPT